MTFKQTFKTFVPKAEVGEVNTEILKKKWKHKRKLCPVDDLDPTFRIMTKQAKCAIVGNSGILLGSNCGKDIDAHDFVLRANLAKLNGYTNDVGNKTSVMMINVSLVRKLYKILTGSSNKSETEKENMFRYFQSIQGAAIWYPKATGGDIAKQLQEIATVLIKEKIPLQFGFSITSAAGETKRKWKTKKLPSTGMIALTVAQSFCRNITLFGFYPYQNDSSGARVLHHYYEPNRTSFHTDVHNFDEEYKMLGTLHDKHVLRRVVGPCKVSGKAQMHQIPSLNRNQTETSAQLDQNQTSTVTGNQRQIDKSPLDQNQTDTLVRSQHHTEKSSQDQVQTETWPRNQGLIQKPTQEQNQTGTMPTKSRSN